MESDKRLHTRENSGIRLDAQGRWWHDGELIEHPGIVEAFNRGISPADGGRFKLELGHDWCFVEVEDAAYRVLAVDPAPEDRLSLRLSDRTTELLEPDTLRLDRDGGLTCEVKGERAKAKFSREAHFSLGSYLEEMPGGKLALKVGARRYPLPHLAR